MRGSFSYWTLVKTGHIITINPIAIAIINSIICKFAKLFDYQTMGGNCARIDTPLNLAVFSAFRTLGANSPRITPTIIVMRTNGVSSRSSMLSSLNGLDGGASASSPSEVRLQLKYLVKKTYAEWPYQLR